MKLILVSLLFLVSVMSSCVYGPSGSGYPGVPQGYGQPRRPGGHSGMGYGPYGSPGAGTYSQGVGQVQHHRQLEGHYVQRRSSNGAAKGNPIWVPAGTDYHSVMEKGLHHNMKKPVTVPKQKFDDFMRQFQ